MKNRFFIVCFCTILSIGLYVLVRTEKDVSISENRSLNKFTHFTLKDFLDGNYQDSLENALTDQFLGSETIKNKSKILFNSLNYRNINHNICNNNYVNLSKYYSFDCGSILLHKPTSINKKKQEEINQILMKYDQVNHKYDTYYYIVNTSNNFDFQKKDYTVNIVELMKNNFKNKYHVSSLKFADYNEYEKMFYKTDHHWNHYGSYIGYTDIIKMISPNDKVLKPVEEVEFKNLNFYGSNARVSSIFEFKENFKAYKFDIKEHTVLNDINKDYYGHQDEYFNGVYNDQKFSNHYAIFYGGDSGELIYNFNNKKDNLLILSNSFSNSVNELIASHFNKTHIIDLRHFEEIKGYKFILDDYISKNKIDKVLFIMDYNYLVSQTVDWRD